MTRAQLSALMAVCAEECVDVELPESFKQKEIARILETMEGRTKGGIGNFNKEADFLGYGQLLCDCLGDVLNEMFGRNDVKAVCAYSVPFGEEWSKQLDLAFQTGLDTRTGKSDIVMPNPAVLHCSEEYSEVFWLARMAMALPHEMIHVLQNAMGLKDDSFASWNAEYSASIPAASLLYAVHAKYPDIVPAELVALALVHNACKSRKDVAMFRENGVLDEYAKLSESHGNAHPQKFVLDIPGAQTFIKMSLALDNLSPEKETLKKLIEDGLALMHN